VIDLPEAFQNLTANGTLEDIEANADYYNSLLKPGEVFGGKVCYVNAHGHFVGGYTNKVFARIQDYIQAISHYRVVEELGDDEDKQADVLSLLQIIRFRSPQKDLLKLRPQTQWTANIVQWQQKRLKYNAAKEESKAAYKAKMVAKDKKARDAYDASKAEIKRLKQKYEPEAKRRHRKKETK
jgi:hypothetical protein